MRRRVLFLAALAAAGGQAALAAQGDPRLDLLFTQLAAARDAGEAQRLEQAIWTIWFETEDPVAALLLEEGSISMARRDYANAREAFDALVERAPEFAEGWNRRATLRWLMNDEVGSVRDIQSTLALEPRHFGALSGLGLILMARDDVPGSIRAFEAALAIHPFLPGARHNLEQLRARLGGQPL